MIKLANRASALKPSPTLALAAKAKELAAKGNDVISLTVGEPDWDTFPRIKQAAIEALEKGQTKYAPANGTPELRQIIATRTSNELGVTYGANQVTVTAGGKMVVFAALQVLCNPGDEVIVPAPFWVSYPPMAELAGAVPIIVDCPAAAGFKMTAAQLSQAITPRTKVLIMNSPSNPTGEMYSREELMALADVLKRHPHVVVLSDDIYNRLTLTGEELAPHLLHVAPELQARVVVINGASKTYSMTGWRLGWAVGEAAVIGAMTNYFSQSVSCAAPFAQIGILAGLKEGDADVQNAVKKLRERSQSALSALRDVPGIEVAAPAGAFYFWPSIQKYIGKSFKGQRINGSREFAEFLLQEEMVAVVPGVEFGSEGYVRLSFVIAEARWQQAMQRLSNFVKNLT
ncbi:MAG: pyridoxal phosphate-dependent aminotransferase [Bdellovibrionales bacterium]